jgi:glycosyltransferase involved in cell wall biosynthesis
VTSFVIPAHNEEALLGRTLESIHVAARTLGEPYEVIVADDASTDRTAEIARSRGAQVVPLSRRQIAAARNVGAKAAAGEYLFFVDADTVVTKRVVRAAFRTLRRGAVGGGCSVKFDGPVPVYGRVIEGVLRVVSPPVGLAAGCFLFCTRRTFDAVGGFDETLFATEEVVFATRLKRLGRFVVLREWVYTSGRKLRTRSALDLIRIGVRLGLGGPAALRRREGMEYWYGPRVRPGRVE